MTGHDSSSTPPASDSGESIPSPEENIPESHASPPTGEPTSSPSSENPPLEEETSSAPWMMDPEEVSRRREEVIEETPEVPPAEAGGTPPEEPPSGGEPPEEPPSEGGEEPSEERGEPEEPREPEEPEEEVERRAIAEMVLNEVAEAVRRVAQREVEERFGRGWFGRLRAFLAGEYDYRILSNGEIRRNWAVFLARKAVGLFLNKRFLIASAVTVGLGIFSGGVALPALYALGGGTIGNLVGEFIQSIAPSAPERIKRELLQRYWNEAHRVITSSLPERGDIGDVGEVLSERIDSFIDQIRNNLREEINRRYHEIAVSSARWDTVKALLFGIGSALGATYGMRVEYLRRLEALWQTARVANYDATSPAHYVFRLGDTEWYLVNRGDYPHIAQALGKGVQEAQARFAEVLSATSQYSAGELVKNLHYWRTPLGILHPTAKLSAEQIAQAMTWLRNYLTVSRLPYLVSLSAVLGAGSWDAVRSIVLSRHLRRGERGEERREVRLPALPPAREEEREEGGEEERPYPESVSYTHLTLPTTERV
mgnify:CR=1 FL=1